MSEVETTRAANEAVDAECAPTADRTADPITLDEKDDKTIRRYASELVGQAGITVSDVEDIEQDLRLELLTYLHRFDLRKGKRRTFINCLLARKCVDLLRHRFAEMYAFNGPLRSLEEKVETDDGPALLLDTVTRADQDRRLNAPQRPVQVDICMEIDLRDAAALLPDDLRELYGDLKTKPIHQIAAERGLHRRTIERRAARLRTWMNDWAIRNFLKSPVAFRTSETKERNRDS